MVEVVAWSPDWAVAFEGVAADLRTALATVPGARVEHVGSTSVPGLAAKPILDTLKARDDLRDAYAAVKLSLADDPHMDIDTYIARKSAVVQRVLEASGEFSAAELAAIRRLNDPDS